MAIIKLNLLLLLSFVALHARAEIKGSVVFFEASNQRFIRDNSIASEGKGKELSTNEVAATISVLLGSAPVLLSTDSSFKLNEVLFPNPFDRPHAVFVLEVTGVKDPLLAFALSNNKVGNVFSSNVVGSSKAVIELSGEDMVSHLDGPSNVKCDAACIIQELAYLEVAHVGTSDSLDGELTFPLASGSSIKLHLSKNSDQVFALSLVSLSRNIKEALENHDVLTENIIKPAELLIGCFRGIEALVEEYGSGDIVHQGVELLETAVTKSFELLQKSYEGKIVGVVLSNRESSTSLDPMININYAAREHRWLAEDGPSVDPSVQVAEVILVRRTLAWITGIILVVSTLIGTWFLFYMPLTRDTLLYSNVKLD